VSGVGITTISYQDLNVGTDRVTKWVSASLRFTVASTTEGVSGQLIDDTNGDGVVRSPVSLCSVGVAGRTQFRNTPSADFIISGSSAFAFSVKFVSTSPTSSTIVSWVLNTRTLVRLDEISTIVTTFGTLRSDVLISSGISLPEPNGQPDLSNTGTIPEKDDD
jgi:hypothetical protein